MSESLNKVLNIQELDMQMMRLMALKNKLQKKLVQIQSLKKELQIQGQAKNEQVANLKRMIKVYEDRVEEIQTRTKQLETKQALVKKVDEFNALTQEIAAVERERTEIENQVTQIVDQLVAEEESLSNIKDSLQSVEDESQLAEQEMIDRIREINKEGRKLQEERSVLIIDTPEDVIRTYERLLRNKKDRVIVPIENRTCSGCHIVLTAQHENLVRKGEKLVFCEHCSRIHYWQESQNIKDAAIVTKRRRRKPTATL